jgi:hypothetical protein
VAHANPAKLAPTIVQSVHVDEEGMIKAQSD